MKRELRLPSKGYDLLRQQVQAKRGLMTNRDPEEGAARAGALAETGADVAGEPGPGGDRLQPVGEPAADGPVTERATSGDPQAVSKAPGKAAGAAQDGLAVTAAARGKVQRRAPKPENPPSPSVARPAEDARITLKLNVKAPAPGLFPFYDRVIATMPPRKALPLLLAKAFEDLEAAVAGGERLAPQDYVSEAGAARVSTSRTMDVALFQAMRAQVDPFELMRRTSLGSAIAKAALCRYLTKRS